MDRVLLSIGHSQHKVDYFIDMLKSHNVNYVLDVRSTPYSQFAANYNKESVRIILQNNGIAYAFMGDYFGARPMDSALYSPKGYLDFEAFLQPEVEHFAILQKMMENYCHLPPVFLLQICH